MSDPYFPGQEPSVCGCYYPDVVRLTDVKHGGNIYRVAHCVTHGVFEFLICDSLYSLEHDLDAFRERESQMLRSRN